MGLIDAATAPLRYVLFMARNDEVAAVEDIERLEAHVVAAVDAIRETTEQLEAHAAVIERLAANPAAADNGDGRAVDADARTG